MPPESQANELRVNEVVSEHVQPVVFQVRVLLAGKFTDPHTLVDSPSIEKFLTNLGDYDQLLSDSARA